ncbi:unnamed protein product, partial [Adineta ricciae]
MTITLFIGQISGYYLNRPKVCSNTTWNPNATTFADNNTVGTYPYVIFINTHNEVYVPSYSFNRILIWSNGSSTPARTISGNIVNPYSLFVTTAGNIYVDSDSSVGRIDQWTSSSTNGTPVMYTCAKCTGLFIDSNNNLYCSMFTDQQVVSKSLDALSNVLIIVAGTRTAGNTSNMLNGPTGIFVNTNFDLYVADSNNHRIQLFSQGQPNARTVAGNGSSNPTTTLQFPTAIILDSDSYMYIADTNNHRIVGERADGFHCLIGCSGSSGSASNQLSSPQGMSFDSYGNMYIVDTNNSRIQKFNLIMNLCNGTSTSTASTVTASTITMSTVAASSTMKNISHNRPKLNAYAAWNHNGITLANYTQLSWNTYGMFIDTNNVFFIPDLSNNQIQVWINNTFNPSKTLSGSFSSPLSVFVMNNNEIYVGSNGRIDRHILGTNVTDSIMFTDGQCLYIFIDISSTVYCSMYDTNKVVKKSLNSNSSTTAIVAGTGCSGSSPSMLAGPHGIFVNTNYDLYIADCGNNRIQLFRPRELLGITAAGSFSHNRTISLNCPRNVILDLDDYMFIADSYGNRVVGQGPYGFRCLIGCFGGPGPTSNQLNYPYDLRFDNDGNLFVVDKANVRIQKYLLLNNTNIPSYNQPKLCSNATWDENATTLVASNSSSLYPYNIHINTNNTVYVLYRTNNETQLWLVNDRTLSTKVFGNSSSSSSIFASNNGDIYIDNGLTQNEVTRWTLKSNVRIPVTYVNKSCYGLFVDTSDSLYCSMKYNHQVVSIWLNENSNTSTPVAGTGTAGNTSNMLNGPTGIFVNTNFDLYVADSNNHRIQLFSQGQPNA